MNCEHVTLLFGAAMRGGGANCHLYNFVELPKVNQSGMIDTPRRHVCTLFIVF